MEGSGAFSEKSAYSKLIFWSYPKTLHTLHYPPLLVIFLTMKWKVNRFPAIDVLHFFPSAQTHGPPIVA